MKAKPLLVALAIGALAALVVWLKTARAGAESDFDQVWHAARILAEGGNPYHEIGPAGRIYWNWPLYYPLPAMLAVAPLAALPIHAARSLFAGAAAGMFTFAILRDGIGRLALIASVPFLQAVQLAQWSPLLSAMYFLPALAWLWVAKPNVGLAILAGSASSRALAIAAAGGVPLVVLAFLVWPGWVVDWLGAIRQAPHVTAPVLRAGGPLLLLALLRWRRPEARLLAALACVPQTPFFYEALPVMLVAERPWEVVGLVLLSDVSFVVAGFLAPASTSMVESAIMYGRLINFFYYLPALVLVLRRPNEGPAPAWLDFVRLPALRSRASANAVGRS